MASAIKKGSDKWMTLYKKGDFKSLAALYTPDCQVYPPGQAMATGRDGKRTSVFFQLIIRFCHFLNVNL